MTYSKAVIFVKDLSFDDTPSESLPRPSDSYPGGKFYQYRNIKGKRQSTFGFIFSFQRYLIKKIQVRTHSV